MIIYLITNKINKKKYVGQHCGTSDSRWKQHLAAALKIENPKPLYASMRKYGVENFTYKVLEILPPYADEKLLDEREIYFIQKYNTFIKNGKGYNLTYGGDGVIGAFCTSQRAEKLSDSLDKTNYAKYDPETGELLVVYEKLSDAAKENNIRNPGTIPTTAKFNNQKSGKYKANGGFVWFSGPNDYVFPKMIEFPKMRSFKPKQIKKKEYNTELAQYTLSGTLVQVWDEPPRDVANQLSIPYMSMINSLKDPRRIASGYFWRRYPKGESPDFIEESMTTHVIQFSRRQLTSYPITKIVEGLEVARYTSVLDAVLDSNLKPTEILNSLELGKSDSTGASWDWVVRPSHIRHSIK
jgi:group I intron endonuclease